MILENSGLDFVFAFTSEFYIFTYFYTVKYRPFIKKMWYIYTMEYYSAIKRNKIMAFASKWMELETIMLSEISQSQRTKG